MAPSTGLGVPVVQTWTLAFDVDTVGRLINGNAVLEGDEDDTRPILTLRSVESLSSYWDVSGEERVFVVWNHYKITTTFEASDDDSARASAVELRSRIASRLSFIVGGPVRLRRGFAITTAPAEADQKVGEQYTTIAAVAEYGAGGPEWSPPVPALDRVLRWLAEASITSVTEDSAPVERAMLWLHTSYEAVSRFMEFSCLMAGLEALSSALDGPGEQHWECAYCHQTVTECPSCQASTARRSSASHVLRDFVTTRLGWPKGDWERAYDVRSRLLHGDRFPTGQDQLDLAVFNPRLEGALLAALKRVLGWGGELPLPRPRLPFADAWLNLQWTPGKGER